MNSNVTLLLVRHGETEGNVNQILQGHQHGKLTGNGILQAQEAAKKVADEHIDAFLSSDLQRAIDTCRVIAGARADEVKAVAVLRERDWGSFTGRFIPDLKDKEWPDDIESLESLIARARQFIDMLRRDYKGQTVLAVGHGIINKAIQSVYHNKPMSEIQKMSNGEVRKLLF